MINIEIRDATALSEVELMATAKYLLALAGHGLAEAKPPMPSSVGVTNLPLPTNAYGSGGSKPVPSFSATNPTPLPILATTEDFVQPDNTLGDTPGKDSFETDKTAPKELANHNHTMTAAAPLPQRTAAEVFGRGADNIIVAALGLNIDGVEVREGEKILFTGELDSEGLPWDRRIHARTKTKISDGTWKLARGSDASIVAGVKAELRKTMAIPKPSGVTRDGTVMVPPPPSFSDGEIAQPMMTFGELTMKISKAIADNRLTHLQIGFVLKEIGIEALPLLAARLDLVPVVSQRIDEVLANG